MKKDSEARQLNDEELKSVTGGAQKDYAYVHAPADLWGITSPGAPAIELQDKQAAADGQLIIIRDDV